MGYTSSTNKIMVPPTGSAPNNVALCAEYLDWMATTKRRSPATVYAYRSSYKSLIAHLDGLLIVDASTENLRGWLYRARNGRPPAPATVKRELAALRALFKWSATRGRLRHPDPTPLLLEEAPKVANDQPKPVPFAAWERVWFDSDLTDAERVILGLGCFVGLRRAEIASLSPTQLVDVPSPTLVGVLRKGGDRQGLRYGSCVDLYAAQLPEWVGDPDSMFYGPLRRLRDSRAGRVALLPFADERTPRHLGRTTHPTPVGVVNPDMVNKRLHATFDRLAVDEAHRFTPHQCRHSFGTNLVTVGVPIEIVSQMMGHSSLDVTRRYVELGGDPLGTFMDRTNSTRPKPSCTVGWVHPPDGQP